MNNKTLILEAYSTNEYGDGPSWARVVITPGLVDEIQRLAALCAEHHLVSVSTYDAPAEWDQEAELRLSYDRHVVDKYDFWYEAAPKHASYSVETRSMTIAYLVKALYGESDGGTVIDGDIVYQNETAKEAYLDSLEESE